MGSTTQQAVSGTGTRTRLLREYRPSFRTCWVYRISCGRCYRILGARQGRSRTERGELALVRSRGIGRVACGVIGFCGRCGERERVGRCRGLVTTRGHCQVDDTFRFAFILGGEESQGDPTQQRALDDQGHHGTHTTWSRPLLARQFRQLRK